MSLTYQDAVSTIEAVPDVPVTLPMYTGTQYDLNYLHDYVLNLVEDWYGVAASDFATATGYSTTILRDFVNRAIFYQPTMPARENVAELYPQYEDVAGLLRYPAGDSCGGVAFQMYQVFRAFGYDTAYIGSIDGGVGLQGTVGSYDESHVSTTVYLDDVGKWVIQDAYCDYTLRDTSGNILSLDEARTIAATDPNGVMLDGLDQYLYYRQDGTTTPVSVADEATIRDCLLALQQSWFITDPQSPGGFVQQNIFSLFTDWTTAHTSLQGGTYASESDAVAAVLAAATSASFNWQATTDVLRNGGHYVSGFDLIADTGDWIKSEWVTVQLSNGDYVSVNMATGQSVEGSYDQLVLEAAGRTDGTHTDMSDFLLPAGFIGANGASFADWQANDVSHSTVVIQVDSANSFNWATSFAQYTTSGVLAHQDFRYDAGGWLDIAYDLDHSQSWWDQQSRYAANGNLEAQRIDYDAGGWSQTNFDVQNLNTWSTATADYNSSGQLTAQHWDYDAGGWLDQVYDVANSQVWSSAQYRYDANGLRDATRFDYDAGGYLKTYFDTTNSQTWWDAQYRYDSSNRLEASRLDWDAGGYTKTNYDTLNKQVWSSDAFDYNAAGQLTHQTFVYDVGGKLDIAYDPTNQYDWSNYQSRYDSNGVIQAELITYDDGHTVRHDYHDGFLIS